MPFRSVEDALSWLDGLIDYERVVPDRRALPSLDSMRELMSALASPELGLSVVHITGTNGKGSVSQMATALLVAKGIRVGTYTSPNLTYVNERLALNGDPISDAELCDALAAVALAAQAHELSVTRFEALTAAALWWFADLGVEVCVVEVGMGGTWDCSNVVEAQVAVISSVALDHTEVLGSTEVEIARDKAGIVKEGSALIVGGVSPEVKAAIIEQLENRGAASMTWLGESLQLRRNELAVGGRVASILTPFALHEDLMIPLHGAHQAGNLAVAIAAVEALFGEPLDASVLEDALAVLEIPGRLEILGHNPLILIDAAHNPAGMQALANCLDEAFSVTGETHLLIGMLEGREVEAMLAPLLELELATIVACAPNSPRAKAAEDVAQGAAGLGVTVEIADSVASGLERLLEIAEDDDLIVVAGSFYVLGDARALLLARQQASSARETDA